MDSNGLKPLNDVLVLMVPLPLQGHLNQLLHLSRLISGSGVAVHYVGTATHNLQARRRIQGWDPLSISNIVFHDFPDINVQSPPPAAAINTSTHFPSHLQPLMDASSFLRQPFTSLLRHLSSGKGRVVIVNDSLMGSVVQDFIEFPNTEAYTFHSVSSFTIFFNLWENLGRPFTVDEEIVESLPSMDGCFTPEFVQFVANQHKYTTLCSGRIYNTCRVLENQFLELLRNLPISGNERQWALGPFHPVNIVVTESRHECLKWLDKQGKHSVIFVSFGTTTSFGDDQVQELATGLEKSGQKFLWVLREADRGDVSTLKKEICLADGYEDRIRGRGMIVRDWVPQLEILGHSSIGGFMSHCGWNSCIESISMGVPIVAWPMHSDQPRNAILITKVLKIGVIVRDWERRDEVVRAEVVEAAVRRMMGSTVGEEMRRRAAELGDAVREATAEGGAARLELDAFISHIARGSISNRRKCAFIGERIWRNDIAQEKIPQETQEIVGST